MKVAFLFRKANPVFFSIERVFFSIEEELRRQGHSIEKAYAPDSGLSAKNFRAVMNRFGRKGMDIYHVTGDIHYAVLGFPRRQVVLTIHDCVFLYNTTGVKRRILKWLFLDAPVKRAAVITTISEFTREEILRFSKCDPGKVVVIPDPVNEAIYFTEKTFNFYVILLNIFMYFLMENTNLKSVFCYLEYFSSYLTLKSKYRNKLYL